MLVILNFWNNQNVYDLLQKDRLQHECYMENGMHLLLIQCWLIILPPVSVARRAKTDRRFLPQSVSEGACDRTHRGWAFFFFFFFCSGFKSPLSYIQYFISVLWLFVFYCDVLLMTLVSTRAFYLNLYWTVIGPTGILSDRKRSDIDLSRMLAGTCTQVSARSKCHLVFELCGLYKNHQGCVQ